MKLTTEKTERPTPETDTQIKTFTSVSKLKKSFENRTGTVSAAFARKLERERDEANRLICATYDALTPDGCDLPPSGINSMPDKVNAILAERDEAREELSSIHRWVERHNQDGFDDKLTHRQNVDICYDLLYDRLDMAELELNRIKRAVIATLDENRHLADGMDCTLIKLRAVVPTWK